MIDIEADKAYSAGGVPMLQWTLETSDTLEHLLSRLGAEIALLKYGDAQMYADLITSKPPGEADILPSWAVAAARDSSKALHQQQQRLRTACHKGPSVSSGDEDHVPGGARERKKKKKAKAKAKASSSS